MLNSRNVPVLQKTLLILTILSNTIKITLIKIIKNKFGSIQKIIHFIVMFIHKKEKTILDKQMQNCLTKYVSGHGRNFTRKLAKPQKFYFLITNI